MIAPFLTQCPDGSLATPPSDDKPCPHCAGKGIIALPNPGAGSATILRCDVCHGSGRDCVVLRAPLTQEA